MSVCNSDDFALQEGKLTFTGDLWVSTNLYAVTMPTPGMDGQ